VRRRQDDDTPDSRRDVVLAYAPYLVIIAIFAVAQIGFVKDALESVGTEFA
jgi:lactate permease